MEVQGDGSAYKGRLLLALQTEILESGVTKGMRSVAHRPIPNIFEVSKALISVNLAVRRKRRFYLRVRLVIGLQCLFMIVNILNKAKRQIKNSTTDEIK